MADTLNLIVNSSVRTKADLLAVEFTVSAGDIENIANLPPGWFSHKAGEVVHLKQNVSRLSDKSEATGVVLPFNRKIEQ